MLLDSINIPIYSLSTCSGILWRNSHGLIGYEPLTAREKLTGMHLDDMYTLELVCQGMQEIYLDGNWRPVPPLHVVWTSPRIMHAHRTSGELETIFALFPSAMVERVWEELYGDCPLQVPHAAILPSPPQLQNALHHLLQEVRSCNQAPDYIISLLLHLALAEFLRLAVQPTPPVPSFATQPLPQERISSEMLHATQLLKESHTCSSLSLECTAQHVGLSLFHFSRRFKQEVGITPGHYLRQQRLNHALQLLFSTTLSMEEVSYLSGFGSARQLTEACKAAFGQSPSTLRKERGFFFLSSNSSPSMYVLPSLENTHPLRESQVLLITNDAKEQISVVEAQ